MSETYAGSNAGPINANIQIPDDGDYLVAASVNPALQALEDDAQCLDAKKLAKAGGTMTGGLVMAADITVANGFKIDCQATSKVRLAAGCVVEANGTGAGLQVPGGGTAASILRGTGILFANALVCDGLFSWPSTCMVASSGARLDGAFVLTDTSTINLGDTTGGCTLASVGVGGLTCSGKWIFTGAIGFPSATIACSGTTTVDLTDTAKITLATGTKIEMSAGSSIDGTGTLAANLTRTGTLTRSGTSAVEYLRARSSVLDASFAAFPVTEQDIVRCPTSVSAHRTWTLATPSAPMRWTLRVPSFGGSFDITVEDAAHVGLCTVAHGGLGSGTVVLLFDGASWDLEGPPYNSSGTAVITVP